MAKGYWIAQVDVEDVDRFKQYGAALPATLAPFGGRFLVRGGQRENVEGEVRKRSVVVEFDSFDLALACYRSAAYQGIIPLRTGAGFADIVVVEGYDGPQP